jgi:hypothetical protein
VAAQGRNGRLMGVAVIAGPLLLTGVVRADPTQADTTSYLNDLHNVGIGDDQGGDAALVQMGQKYASKWDTALLPDSWWPSRRNAPTPTRALVGSTPSKPTTSLTAPPPSSARASSRC